MHLSPFPARRLALATLALLATWEGQAAQAQAPPAPPGAGAQSQDDALGEAYREGATYAGNARIALDDAGHTISFQAGTGRMADFGDAPLFVVVATISGPAARWAFTFGKESSGLTLLADGKRHAPVEAQFAAPVVAKVDPAAKPERSRHRTDGETVVVDLTEHPLAIIFRLPGRALRAPQKTLSLRGFELAGRVYSFDLLFSE